MKICAIVLLSLSVAPATLMGQSVRAGASISSSEAQAPVDEASLQRLLLAEAPTVVYRTDDVLSVQIVGIQDYAMKQRVAEDGTIYFSLLGSVHVAGLTTEQLQLELERELAQKGLIMHPQLTIINESRPSQIVSVLGDVVRPGTFPATGRLTVVDYISQAQGFVETVSGSQFSSAANYSVMLIRPGSGAVRIPLGTRPGNANWGRIPVFAGDEIRVDKIGLIYAVGALRAQGSFQLKNTDKTTVSQLIALAGGMGYEADFKDSHIVRRSGDQTTIISLNANRILKGKDPDIALQSEDILFIPSNQLKAAIKGGGSAIIVSLASAALYSR